MTPAEQMAKAKAEGTRCSPNGERVVMKCRCKELREQLGLSRMDVCSAIGMTPQNLMFVESGQNTRLDSAIRLAAFFGKTIEELWTLNERLET